MNYYEANQTHSELSKSGKDKVKVTDISNILIELGDKIKVLLNELQYKYVIQLNRVSQYDSRAWNIEMNTIHSKKLLTPKELLANITNKVIHDELKDLLYLSRFPKEITTDFNIRPECKTSDEKTHASITISRL